MTPGEFTLLKRGIDAYRVPEHPMAFNSVARGISALICLGCNNGIHFSKKKEMILEATANCTCTDAWVPEWDDLVGEIPYATHQEAGAAGIQYLLFHLGVEACSVRVTVPNNYTGDNSKGGGSKKRFFVWCHQGIIEFSAKRTVEGGVDKWYVREIPTGKEELVYHKCIGAVNNAADAPSNGREVNHLEEPYAELLEGCGTCGLCFDYERMYTYNCTCSFNACAECVYSFSNTRQSDRGETFISEFYCVDPQSFCPGCKLPVSRYTALGSQTSLPIPKPEAYVYKRPVTMEQMKLYDGWMRAKIEPLHHKIVALQHDVRSLSCWCVCCLAFYLKTLIRWFSSTADHCS